MASQLTAATTLQESNGSLTLFKVTFTSVSTAGDYWYSGLQTSQTVGCWANVTSGIIPIVSTTGTCNTSNSTITAASTCVLNGINVKEDGGTFTLYPNMGPVPVTLNIWARA